MDYSAISGQWTPANPYQYASPEGAAFALQQLQRFFPNATYGQPAQASPGSPYYLGSAPTLTVPGTDWRMNAGEIAKIYSQYPNQQAADTALQTTMRNDFGYNAALPQPVLNAINPAAGGAPAQTPAIVNPQQPPATSTLMPPSVVPQPGQATPAPARAQEGFGMPSGQVQAGAGGASRQQPSQGQGRPSSGSNNGFQQLMQMVTMLRQRGLQI